MGKQTRKSGSLGNYLGVHLGGVTICLVLVGLVYAFGYRPYAKEKLELHTQQSEFARLQSLHPRLIQENRELKDKYQQYATVIKSDPTATYSDGPILDLVSGMLLHREVQLKNFVIKIDTPNDTIVDLKLAGKFGSIAGLLKDFDEMRSPAKLLNLTMNSTAPDGETCSATLTIHFTKLAEQPTLDANVVQKSSSLVEGASNG
ncbi:MAG: hypothetical protein AB8B50_16040 [Pirellulaceae bacterium]